MARFDAYNSECLLFSFKDGLLARLAHDLKLQVSRFSIEVDESTQAIKATFDPSARPDGHEPGTEHLVRLAREAGVPVGVYLSDSAQLMHENGEEKEIAMSDHNRSGRSVPDGVWTHDQLEEVLGAGTDKKGPGPLVTQLSRNSGSLPVPITIVPGDLSKERLEAIT